MIFLSAWLLLFEKLEKKTTTADKVDTSQCTKQKHTVFPCVSPKQSANHCNTLQSVEQEHSPITAVRLGLKGHCAERSATDIDVNIYSLACISCYVRKP